MAPSSHLFQTEQPMRRRPGLGDLLALLGLAVLLYGGVRLAFFSPQQIEGPSITLDPRALPRYALYSLARMALAYILSLVFMLLYGNAAARSRIAERILLPLLDVLQSVPLLSFLPVILLAFTAILPERVAVQLASVALIVTSQAWNLTFAWYQALNSIPKELGEASAIFRMGPWLRFRMLELPFAAPSLIWNSMMSWAGGWFFLMAAETLTVGQRDFRLAGLGSYLHEAANRADWAAVAWGLGALVLLIVALDQLLWRPLLAWVERSGQRDTQSTGPLHSWAYDAWQGARLRQWLARTITYPLSDRLDLWLTRRFPADSASEAPRRAARGLALGVTVIVSLGLLYGALRAVGMLTTVPPAQWLTIGWGLLATLLRVAVALLLALAWTIPVGVAIGTDARLAAWLQPLVQVTASIPATALFPVVLLVVLRLPQGLNIAAILLMLLGTQWYLLFNIIAGATAIPRDLQYTTELMQLSRLGRWRILVLPALFPYIVTGGITASGGAWNASIVAEYISFGGRTFRTVGIGALIAEATATGDYALLLAATLVMVLAVVLINRLIWRRLYQLAENKYRME